MSSAWRRLCGRVGSLEIIRQGRDPANAIVRSVKEQKVDPLFVGEIKKESAFRYYLSSVARTLMRRSLCSVLFFTKPSDHPAGFKNLSVFVEFATNGEDTLRTVQRRALLEEAAELHLPVVFVFLFASIRFSLTLSRLKLRSKLCKIFL